ncbi:hypothetical protein F5144DRAFT_306993 [Chaetomium tenue]|uniref:Uncharacterized protein n=1 Tax=Chaetomium tenue TaxID=1854479 RepID=A0ACB7P592_9PEZI|nr:hypothetical protein F5144DRAFT_306993 [Chaetomium globosum]
MESKPHHPFLPLPWKFCLPFAKLESLALILPGTVGHNLERPACPVCTDMYVISPPSSRPEITIPRTGSKKSPGCVARIAFSYFPLRETQFPDTSEERDPCQGWKDRLDGFGSKFLTRGIAPLLEQGPKPLWFWIPKFRPQRLRRRPRSTR